VLELGLGFKLGLPHLILKNLTITLTLTLNPTHNDQGVASALLTELTGEDLFLDLALSKGGVLLWLLELAKWTASKG
jgi:hypothetical protein